MKQDMTTGSSIKIITRFSAAVLIGNIFQQLYQMADTVIVGTILGVDALAAVGTTGPLQFLVIGSIIALCGGFGVPIAHFVGAKDDAGIRKCIVNAFFLCFVIALILMTITMSSAGWMLRTMGTPENIFQDAYRYLIMIFLGIGAVMFYNLLLTISRAMGDVKTPLMFLIISSVLNFILAILLVRYTPLGTMGAGMATALAQAISAIVYFIYMYRKYPVLHIKRKDCKIEFAIIKRLLLIGIPMSVQLSITAVGAIVVQSAVNSLGSIVVAGVTASSRIQGVMIQAPEAMGITMATFAGQNFGAGKIDRIKKGMQQSMVLMAGYSVIAFLILHFLGGALTSLFVQGENPELIYYTTQIMSLNGLFYMALGVLLILRNIIQGMGYATAAMIAGVGELVGRVFIALVLVRRWGFEAVRWSNPTAWILAAVLLIFMYIYVMNQIKKRPMYP